MFGTYLKNLFSRTSDRAGWGCPGEITLAGYVDGQLDEKAKPALESHLADCDWCLAQVSFLVRSEAHQEFPPVPAAVLARSKALVERDRTPFQNKRVWGWAAAGAAACLLVMGIFLIARYRSPMDEFVARSEPIVQTNPVTPAPAETAKSSPRVNKSAAPSTSPVVRSNPTAVRSNTIVTAGSPAILSPIEQSVIKSDQLALRWKPVSDVVFYEVFILNKDGDGVFNLKTQQTDLKPAIKLAVGEKYFVQVVATLPEGKTMKSNMVSFRVAN